MLNSWRVSLMINSDKKVSRATAELIQVRALSAVRELNAIAALPVDWVADETLKQVRKAVGETIWQIDQQILARLYREFPEMNDLKDMDLTQFDPLFRE
jgi:hypothetical protein